MDNDFEGFIKTFDSPNTARVVKSLQAIGDYDYSNCTPFDIENITLNLKPNSPKAITTIIYIMSLYAKHLGNKDMLHMIEDIDRNALWLLAKPNATKKFISNKDFENVYHEIGVHEEHNSFYIQTLFRCLYEGIYCDDMSVIKNLRASDVNDSVVTLRDDNGNEYDITVSDRLAGDLVKLGDVDTWSRNNRYGVCSIAITGLHKDSCFKVENRKGSSEYSYRFSYYRILRNIAKNYVGYSLLPLQLYVSGIMYRIGKMLKHHDIAIQDAFSDNNRDKIVNTIITNELTRCMCDTPVRNFREMVKGHLEVFDTF